MSLSFSQESVKVITYNLEGMKPGTQPEVRISAIINAFVNFDPDIIGLQEINEKLDGSDNQIKAISDSLSAYFGITFYYYQQSTHLSWDNQFREYIGIISKFPVTKKGYKSLPQGTFPRKVVWNYIETAVGKINFFNTHLSYNSESTRISQVKALKDYITAIEGYNPGLFTIVTGDFNDTPASQPIKLMTESASDTFFVASFFQGSSNSQGFTVPSNSPTSKIDYIFYKNSGFGVVDTSKIIMTTGDCQGTVCSDHLGIMTIFTVFTTGIGSTGGSLLPENIELGQNYPNPFNPQTIIPYKILHSTIVQLTIFDSAGREIKHLVNSFKQAGSYNVRWNGLDNNHLPVSSGLYLYRLKADGKTNIGKVILLK